MPAPEVCLDFPLLSEQRSNGSKYAAGPDPEVVSGSSDAPSLPVARQVARSQDGLRAVACVPLQMTHEGFLASPDDDGLRALDARLPREVLADILESLNAAARSHAAASALVFTTLMVATAALAALVLVPYELYKGRKRLAALEDTIKSLNQRYSHGAGGFDDGPAGPMAGAGDEVFGAGGGSADPRGRLVHTGGGGGGGQCDAGVTPQQQPEGAAALPPVLVHFLRNVQTSPCLWSLIGNDEKQAPPPAPLKQVISRYGYLDQVWWLAAVAYDDSERWRLPGEALVEVGMAIEVD
eukprot:XP_001703096.1 predicted protein [Chlamydomonas reinhardtii]